MNIISSVSHNQSALIPSYVQKWERVVSSSNELKQTNRASIEASVQSLYTALGRPSPQIRFFTDCKEIESLRQQVSIAPLLDWLGEPVYVSLLIAELVRQLSQKMESDIFANLTGSLTDQEFVDIKKEMPEILVQEYLLQFAEEDFPIHKAIEAESHINMSAQPSYLSWTITLKCPEWDFSTHRAILDESFFEDICAEFNLQLRSFLHQLPDVGKQLQQQIEITQAQVRNRKPAYDAYDFMEQDLVELITSINSIDSSMLSQQYSDEFWSVELYRVWLTAAAFTNWNIGLLSVLCTGYTYPRPFAFLDYCMDVLFDGSDLHLTLPTKDKHLINAVLSAAQSGAVMFTFERVCFVLCPSQAE